MAEREGFEPSRRLPAYTRSRRAPSTTRPPLLICTRCSFRVGRREAHASLSWNGSAVRTVSAFDHSATSPNLHPMFVPGGSKRSARLSVVESVRFNGPWAPSTTRPPLLAARIGVCNPCRSGRTIQISVPGASSGCHNRQLSAPTRFSAADCANRRAALHR